MSESRADSPPASPAASAMGLGTGAPTAIAPGQSPTPPVPASLRDQIKAKWIAAGATPAGAEGILQNIQRESGFNPTEVGDNGTSFGLYQHHNDRAMRLAEFAKSQGKSPSDPIVQTDFAIKEATQGGDAQATQHRDLFMKASNPGAANAAFKAYFERPASLSQQMMTPSNGAAIAQRMGQFDQTVAARAEADRMEYERIRSEADPGSKERRELLSEARERAARYRDMYEDFARNPPSEKPIDALQNFGSIGTMLALLIGGMGRHHMNGALAAAGAMMQAAQANNHEQFERQYKIWDHQSTTALNLSRLESDEVRQLLEDKRLAENDRQARLHNFFEEHQMTFQAQQMRAGMMEHAAQIEAQRERATENANYQRLQFGQMMYQNWLSTHPNASDDDRSQQAKFFGVIPAGGGVGATLTQKDAHLAAEEFVAGNKQAIVGFGRSPANQGLIWHEISSIAESKGMTGADLAALFADYQGYTAGQRTLSQREANIGMAVASAQNLMPLAEQASALVDRTKYPKLNEWMLAVDRAMGDSAPIKLSVATNSFLNAYSRAVAPTGVPTDDVRRHAYELLEKSFNQGQYSAALKQMSLEMQAEQKAPGVVREQMREEFKGGPLTKQIIDSTEGDTGQTYNAPDDVYRAFDDGKITKDQAKQILIDKFGAKPQ